METSDELAVATHPFGFSLQGLLIVVTVVAFMAAPIHWFGGAYLVSATLTACLVLACNWAHRGNHPWLAVGVAAGSVPFGFLFGFMSLVFFFHTLLNAFFCLLLVLLRVKPRTFGIALAGLAAAIYGLAFISAAGRGRELAELKTKYPFVSLEERLAFERSEHSMEEALPSPIRLTATLAAHLDELEQDRGVPRYFSRTWALRELHENSYRHFAGAAGFGMMRMPTVESRIVAYDQPTAIQLPLPISIDSVNPSNRELYSTHRAAVFDFVDPDKIGYVRGRDAVAGFQSHQFNSLDRTWRGYGEQQLPWQVTRIELVSLLRHEEPRVYVADSMPRMDHLADVPNRPLNEFERAGLPKLYDAEDIVVDQQPDRILMLGAVRAGNSCLACHEGDRGRLLGAFSYEITSRVIAMTTPTR